MIKILGKSTSINVRKVLWTCRELDLPFEHEQWGEGHRPTTTPEFLALNPIALVPVLIDGNFVTAESNTIIRYLANAHDPSARLLPHKPRERARIERWMDFQATELNNAWRYAFMSLVRRHPDFQDARLVAAGIETWSKWMTILDAQLASTGAFMTGDRLTLADIVIGLSVHRWYSTPFEHPSLAAVKTYYERLSIRPGFQVFGCNGIP